MITLTSDVLEKMEEEMETSELMSYIIIYLKFFFNSPI